MTGRRQKITEESLCFMFLRRIVCEMSRPTFLGGGAPPLSIHMEISKNGLSVPLSWNSWSELPDTFHDEGLILSPNVQPLFGLFSSLLFSNHAQCLVHHKLKFPVQFLLDHISFELCLPFVVLHQFERIRASAP